MDYILVELLFHSNKNYYTKIIIIKTYQTHNNNKQMEQDWYNLSSHCQFSIARDYEHNIRKHENVKETRHKISRVRIIENSKMLASPTNFIIDWSMTFHAYHFHFIHQYKTFCVYACGTSIVLYYTHQKSGEFWRKWKDHHHHRRRMWRSTNTRSAWTN